MKQFKRIGGIMAMVCASMLAACTVPAGIDGYATAPPAPLASTQIDDQTLIATYKAFEAVLVSVDALRDFGVIKDGTPKAIALAGHLEAAKHWLNVATEAQRLGQADSYAAAMAQAQAGFVAIKRALE